MLKSVKKLLLPGFIVWCVILVCAILNGALRQFVLLPLLGFMALPISGICLAALITVIIYAMLKWQGKIYNNQELLLLGLSWFLLTIIFEFGFGHYVMGHPWAELLAAYDLSTGNLWSLIILYIVVAPLMIYKRLVQ